MYFDTGIALTSYPIKIFLVIGIGVAVDDVKNLKLIVLLGFLYGIFSFVLGWAWYKYKWMEAQWEVTNRYNLIMKEIRASPIMNGKQKVIKR